MRASLAALTAIALAMASASPARSGDCEDAGRMGSMLGYIDKQCPGWQLTEKGREVMVAMAARVLSLGGDICVAQGKAEMLRDMALYNSALGKLAEAGDQEKFTDGLCVAISKYLTIVVSQGSRSPLVEKRKTGNRLTQSGQPICATQDDLPRYTMAGSPSCRSCRYIGAGDRDRTDDIQLGKQFKLVLYDSSLD